MKTLENKNIVLGVSGGIAVYKAVDLVSRLVKLGATVDIIMTENATKFVTPLTFQSISHRKVTVKMFSEVHYWDVEHISLAKKADIFAIVPATANIIGKLANGIADDMLTTVAMAVKSPVMIAPAMNTNMYNNIIYKNNEEKLKKAGYLFIEPDSGYLACGDLGKGKLPSPEVILKEIEMQLLKKDDLLDKKILVTAGPTIEAIDPVRYLTNRSSGKMGYAIAEEAAKNGASVTLITGPTNIEIPIGLDNIISIESANEMYNKVMENLDYDIIIMTAAVSDYKPVNKSENKIKKSGENLVINLDRNKDILYNIGLNKKSQLLIGFAAETENIEKYAKRKLKEKNLDLIVANDVSNKNIGFASDNNKVIFYDNKGNKESLDTMTKKEIARAIINRIIKLLE